MALREIVLLLRYMLKASKSLQPALITIFPVDFSVELENVPLV